MDIFGKREAKVLYGIAVFLMVAHHILRFPERLDYQIQWIFPNVYGLEYPLEWYIGDFGKICVSMYAFISGYGLYKLRKNYTSWSIKDDYISTIKRIAKFYSVYWLVYLVSIPMGILVFNYKTTILNEILVLIGDKSGLNGEWWYVYQYIKMLIFFPLIVYLMKLIDIKTTAKSMCLLCNLILLFVIYYKLGLYVCIFTVGVYISKYNIFDHSYMIVPQKIKIYVGIMLMLFSILVRQFFTSHYNMLLKPQIDIVVTPIFIFSILLILHECKCFSISKVFTILGKYSVFIWLTHTFFVYYYFQNIAVFPRYSLLICIWVLFLSLLVSMCLDKIYCSIKNFKKVTMKGNR